MISAFGISHDGEISKADRERAKHYRNMAATTGTIGGASGATAVGARIVGGLEAKGRDPMGFTLKSGPDEPEMKDAVKARKLKLISRVHMTQSKQLGAVGAAGLALAGAYKYKQKKELSKRDKRKSDLALGAGSVGVAGGAAKYGGFWAKDLNEHAEVARAEGVAAHKDLKAYKKYGENPQHHIDYARKLRSTSARVYGVKKPAAALAAGTALAGVATIGEMARYHAQKPVKKSLGTKLGLQRGPHRLTGIMSDLAGTTTVTTRRSGTWALKPSERIVTTNRITGKGTEYRSGGGTTKKAKAAVFGASAVAASPAGYYGAKKVNIS